MSDRPTQREGVPGVVQAFDVRTGKPRWKFNPIPRPGEVGSETWENDSWSYSGDANLWSLISADEEQGLAYLPMTSPTSDMYGGHRLGNNVFANTLVCVRCATGERVWHYQIVHHDLWDYDLPAAPILADIRVDGKPIKAVVQLTKQAFAFVFDRLTGRPVWPIEERPVPASDVPGERTAPTQPFPTKPPAFDRQGVDHRRSHRLHAGAARRSDRAAQALSRRPAVHAAVGARRRSGRPSWDDPAARLGRRRRLAERSVRSGDRHAVRPVDHHPVHGGHPQADPRTRTSTTCPARAPGPAGPQGLPLFKPPYGRITAIDLNKGEQLWMTPNGDGPRDHPLLKPLNLPPLGNPGRSSPLVTKTLVFLGEGDPVMAALGSRLRPEMPRTLAPG